MIFVGAHTAVAGHLLKYEAAATNENVLLSYDNEQPCILQIEKYDRSAPSKLTAKLTTYLPFYVIDPQDQRLSALTFTQNLLHVAHRSKEKAEPAGQDVSEKFGDYLRFATKQSAAFTQDFSHYYTVSSDLNAASEIEDPEKRSQFVSMKLGEPIKSGYFGPFIKRNHVEVFLHEGAPTYAVGPLLDWVLPTPNQDAKRVQAELEHHLVTHCSIEKVIETW